MQPVKAACRKIGRWKGQGADDMQYCRQETLERGLWDENGGGGTSQPACDPQLHPIQAAGSWTGRLPAEGGPADRSLDHRQTRQVGMPALINGLTKGGFG